MFRFLLSIYDFQALSTPALSSKISFSGDDYGIHPTKDSPINDYRLLNFETLPTRHAKQKLDSCP